MELAVVTSNIAADFTSPPGVPAWDERRDAYIELIRDAEPDLISVQEVMPRQLRFLRHELPDHCVIAVNYIDGENGSGESSELHHVGDEEIPNPYEVALFYKKDRLEVVESGHWWMSPTPSHPSVGFGNRWPRVVVWASFRSGEVSFTIFATHVDHRAVDAMIDVCRPRFDLLRVKAATQILAGDLNFNPTHAAYRALATDGWNDSGQGLKGAEPTFIYDVPQWPSGRIDHILWRGSAVTAQDWCRLLPVFGKPPISDHHPVYARLRLE